MVEKITRADGISVLLLPTRRTTKVWLTLRFRGGSDAEKHAWHSSAIERGSFFLLSQLLYSASEKMDKESLARITKKNAIDSSAVCSESFFGLNLTFLREKTATSLSLLETLLRRKSFIEEEFNNEKEQILYALKKEEESGERMSMRAFLKVFFAGSPYGEDPRGTIEQVKKLDFKKINTLWQETFSPQQAVCAVAGHDEKTGGRAAAKVAGRAGSEVFLDALENIFASGKKGALPMRPEIESIPFLNEEFTHRLKSLDDKKRMVRQSYKSGKQVFVKLGFSLPSLFHPQFLIARLMGSYLTGMSGPLFALRNVPFTSGGVNLGGRAYVMGARLLTGYGYGGLLLYASLREEASKEWQWVLEKFYEVAKNLRTKGLDQKLIEENINQIKAERFLQMGKVSYRASRYAVYESYGLGYERWEQEIKRMETTTMDEVRDFAAKYLTYENSMQHVFYPEHVKID